MSELHDPMAWPGGSCLICYAYVPRGERHSHALSEEKPGLADLRALVLALVPRCGARECRAPATKDRGDGLTMCDACCAAHERRTEENPRLRGLWGTSSDLPHAEALRRVLGANQ